MNKLLPVLAISALLLTGCSTPTPESKPEYDEVELMVYEKCVSAFVDTFTDRNKNTLAYVSNLPETLNLAQESCKSLKPIKK